MMEYIPKWLLQQYDQLSPTQFYFTSFAVVIAATYFLLRNRGLPPGPIGVPILGYWPFLKDSVCYLQLTELQKKYGDVFCFNYAGTLVVSLGSHKALREFHVSNSDCFERVYDYMFLRHIFEDSIAFANDERWKTLRKFTHQQFKEIGMTVVKEGIGGYVLDCIKETVDDLKSRNGQPVDIIELMMEKSIGIVRWVLFRNFGITMEEMRYFINAYTQIISFLSVKNSLLVGNIARYLILPLQPGYRKAMKNSAEIQNFFYEIVQRHKGYLDENNPRDFIDRWLIEANLRYSKNDPSAKHFTDKALSDNLNQFAGDIGMTVAAFVGSFLIYAVQHPHEQEKVYEELMDVIGSDRNPSIEDKNKLPYTNAFMWEIQRISNFFTLLLSQQCTKETTIRGYRIPKEAVTLMNEWSCHHDPDIYEDPDTFNPSRWLPEDGKPRPELPVIFGIGKRNCIGEEYVMIQTFLFFTTLIKNFKFTIPDDSTSSFYDILSDFKMEVVAEPRN